METVITVNLNGNAYQLETAGHARLEAYVDRARAQLSGNPDASEILADLEQAIADKCQRVLARHKTVVTSAEVEQVLKEMGPVDEARGEDDALFGWPIPAGIPIWVAALGLIVLYQFAAVPLTMAGAWHHPGPPSPVVIRSDGIVSLVALVILGWLAYQYVPAFHDLVLRVWAQVQTVK